MIKRILTVLLLFPTLVCAQINTERVMTIARNALYFEDYVLSIQYFNQVINAKPYLYEPYFFRALAKVNLEDYQGAEADCDEAIKRNPFVVGAYQVRGLARIRQSKFDGLPSVPPHLLQFHLGVGRFQLILLRKYPHLYVGKGGVSVMIIGVMHHSAPCAYDLRLAGGNGRNVADVVTVVDSPFGRDEHDFHIVVGVRFKAFAAFNRIVVQHSKRSEVDTARIVVICKTEGEIALQPTVVGKPPAPRTVNYFLHMYSIYDTTKYKNRSTRIKRGRLNTHPDN